MRKYIVFVLLLFALSLSAQSNKEKRVYYLDCSKSMLEKDGGKSRWEKVSKNLEEAIKKIDDSETIVEVVCFAYDAYHNDAFIPEGYSICTFANDSGKTKLINFINTRTIADETMTYHDVPLWDFINNNRIDKERDTYFYLMTDGKDQYHEMKEDLRYELPEGKHNSDFFNKYSETRLFDNLIRQHWSTISNNKNVFGFYVRLDEVEDTKRKELCSNTRYFWYMQTADVDVNTIRTDTTKTSVLYNGSVQIHLKGKKNLHGVEPELNFEDRYYSLPHSYSNGVLTINPTIKPGVRAKDIPESEHIKIILSTKEKVTYNNKSQFNIIVDEELELDVKCKQNPISFTLENDEDYNVRKSKSFILTTKGDLSKVERINIWFADSTNLSAKTEININDNTLIVSPILKTDSTYYIDKFTNQSIQDFKIYYSLESKDPFTYIEGSNSLTVKFEGKWEKWLRTFIEACDKSKSFFSIICSWFSSEIESSLGTVTYYPSFLWKEANTTNSNAKWNFVFTKDALGIAGTMVKLQFCDKVGTPLDTTQYKFFVNGQLIEENKFEVSNKVTQLDVNVWMRPGVSSHTCWGKDEFEGNLKVITYNELIGINKTAISEGSLVLPWTITYEKTLNPIIVFFLWLLFYLFLLWVAIKGLLWWRAKNSPKFPNDMWVHIRPGSGFDPTKDKNVHFEGKSIFKGTIERVLTIDNGNSINTNILSDLFIKELVVLKPNLDVSSQGNWDRKYNGEIIFVNCEFFNNNIEKIIMTPLSNSIVVTICYSEGCGFEKESFEINIQDRNMKRKDTDAFAIPNSRLCIQGRIHTDEEVD